MSIIARRLVRTGVGIARSRPSQLLSCCRLTTSAGPQLPVRSKVPPTPPPFRRSKKYEEARAHWDEPPESWDRGYDNPDQSYTPEVQVPLGGIIRAEDTVSEILGQPVLIIERKLELMNVFLGFEQANRYTIMDSEGNLLGFMEEEDFGIAKAVMRQVYRLHRPFTVRLYNKHGQHVLTIRRPFSFINSHIKAILPSSHEENSIVIGESRQSWHLWRRRYNLFMSTGPEEYDQFGKIDSPFLSFSFPIHDKDGLIMGSVDRNWVGLGREMFTDTGVYMVRMDPSALAQIEAPENLATSALTLDERAILLGTAISIDFDYFSRHSGRGGFVSFDE